MSKVVVFSRPDGGVSVVVPARQYTIDQLDSVAIEAIANQGLGPTPYQIVDAAALPQDRRWRTAWRHDGQKVRVDLGEARKVRAAELRAERDVQLQRVRQMTAEADEDDDVPKAKKHRQLAKALRDLDAKLDAALTAVQDLAALAAFVPAEMKELA